MCPGILMIPETHEIVRRLVFRARKIFCDCIKRIGCEECFTFAEYGATGEFARHNKALRRTLTVRRTASGNKEPFIHILSLRSLKMNDKMISENTANNVSAELSARRSGGENMRHVAKHKRINAAEVVLTVIIVVLVCALAVSLVIIDKLHKNNLFSKNILLANNFPLGFSRLR